MTVAAARPLHQEPPENIILRDVGDLSGVNIVGQYVLIGLYERQEGKSAGGVWIPSKALEEDQYQSKCGLVLKVGPRAFVDEGGVSFHGFKVRPGDWVVFKASDGLTMQIGTKVCKLMADVYIKMVIDHPDLVH